jgi:hypothetical protein
VEFPGVNGTSYTAASLQMSVGGDTIIPRSVTAGGREVEQVAVFAVGERVAQALITGAEKAKEVSTSFDPMSYIAWIETKEALALQRPTISLLLVEANLPSIRIDYEECGYMGEEFPEMKGGEAAEFVPACKWQPTRVRVNGKLLTSAATI